MIVNISYQRIRASASFPSEIHPVSSLFCFIFVSLDFRTPWFPPARWGSLPHGTAIMRQFPRINLSQIICHSPWMKQTYYRGLCLNKVSKFFIVVIYWLRLQFFCGFNSLPISMTSTRLWVNRRLLQSCSRAAGTMLARSRRPQLEKEVILRSCRATHCTAGLTRWTGSCAVRPAS